MDLAIWGFVIAFLTQGIAYWMGKALLNGAKKGIEAGYKKWKKEIYENLPRF